MLEKFDLDKVAILVDFDGTITSKDTNVELIKKHGNKLEDIKKDYREGNLTFTEYFQAEISRVQITEEEYVDFILNDIKLSPGFMDFYRTVKEKDIKLGLVSGGFENGIKPFLSKHGIENMDIFANKLEFNGNQPKIVFRDGMYDDCCDLGPCGNCKLEHYSEYKEDYEKVIFIGDGTTDKPVARISDMVFAKESLANYLEEHNIDYIAYEDFKDINRKLFQ